MHVQYRSENLKPDIIRAKLHLTHDKQCSCKTLCYRFSNCYARTDGETAEKTQQL
jgi:hypothetical protein